jgi:diguanylate cyclase (GGDEF)-like protein
MPLGKRVRPRTAVAAPPRCSAGGSCLHLTGRCRFESLPAGTTAAVLVTCWVAGLIVRLLIVRLLIVRLPRTSRPGLKSGVRLDDKGQGDREQEGGRVRTSETDPPPAVPGPSEQLRQERERCRALVEDEHRLRQAFDATPEGLAIFRVEQDADGRVGAICPLLCNAWARTRLGLVVEDQCESERLSQVPSAVLEWVCGQARTVWSGVDVVTSRETVETLDGTMRLLDSSVVPLDDGTLLCIWQDVTDLVQAEQLLSRAYEETAEMRVTLQTALDSTNDGFAIYQLEWDETRSRLTGLRVVHANASGAESLGLDPEAMVGMELHEFLPDVESTGLWGRIEVAAITKEPQLHRVQVFDEEGEWRSAWDNTVTPVGEERVTITWRDASKEEAAIRQLARTRDEAMYSATHDALTGLPNRVLLRQRLHEALGSCPGDRRVGIVFVDLNHFKAINDTYGHATGDVVLKETAARLARLTRHGDLAARLAGDEFILVLDGLPPNWSSDQFFARAGSMLSEPVSAESVELVPSASFGVVLADPRHERVGVDELIKRADAAMYRAKATSRRR